MKRVQKSSLRALAAGLCSAFASTASAQPPAVPEPALGTVSTPAPAPYSIPFQLRGAQASSVVRADAMFAFYEDAAGESGSTTAGTLTAAYKVTPELSPLLRLGFVTHSPPSPASGATAVLNPLLGAIYGLKLSPDLRLGLFLGATLPIGSGGGNSPDPEVRAALGAGVLARAGMDNALFAVNYLTIAPGVDLAYVSGGLTLQVEATLFQLARVRGDEVDTDGSRTNSTSGIHVGYFLAPFLSAAVELRHQRWLSTPANVRANAAARDITSLAVGPRFHFKLTDSVWARPAVAYVRGLDDPMSDGEYHIVHVDLAFPF